MLIPNVGVKLAWALSLTFAVLFIPKLSFLDLGVQTPNADWGDIMKEHKDGSVYGIPAGMKTCNKTSRLAILGMRKWSMTATFCAKLSLRLRFCP